MPDNIGTADRMVRVVAAALMLVFFFFAQITQTAAIALLVAAVYLVITGLLEYDPVYQLVGLATRGK